MLLVLIIMIVFVVMMTYTLRFIVRQSHETINQTQEEQAFGVADSGVSYAYWLLDPAGGNYIPATFPAIIDHVVTDDLGQQIGTFSFVDVATGTGFVQLRSIGKDASLVDKCQSIAIELRQLQAGEPYMITQWNHQVGSLCT